MRSAAPISHPQTRGLPQVCGRPRRLSPGCPGSSSQFYLSSCQSCTWDQLVWEIQHAAFLASALVVAVESGWKDKNGREILWRWSTCLLVSNKVKHVCPKDWHDLFWLVMPVLWTSFLIIFPLCSVNGLVQRPSVFSMTMQPHHWN